MEVYIKGVLFRECTRCVDRTSPKRYQVISGLSNTKTIVVLRSNEPSRLLLHGGGKARQRKCFPNLHRMALDLLSIPDMTAEPERLFSECKRIITDDRHSLQSDTIEVLGSLKSYNRHQWKVEWEG